MKRILIKIMILAVCTEAAIAQQTLSSTFELRYFTDDKSANGETDFKGEKEWMNVEQRVEFLGDYAKYAGNYFNDPGLDTKIVSKKEVDSLLGSIKPQPSTSVRKTIQLDKWKAYGYKKGMDTQKIASLKKWNSFQGASIEQGSLVLTDNTIHYAIDSLNWRFKIEATLTVNGSSNFSIELGDGDVQGVLFGWKDGNLICDSGVETISHKGLADENLKIKLEVDLTGKKFNLYANDKQLEYYIPISDTAIKTITQLNITSEGTSRLEDIFIFNYIKQKKIEYPYVSRVVLDEDFEERPSIEGWQNLDFDDAHWNDVNLPSVHGGVRNKEESYYLRTKLKPGDHERAVLKLETLDPGGEVWVNGEVVDVIRDRHPVELDVTKMILPGQENIIAIRVFPYKASLAISHSPTDHHFGWFLGRSKLELSSKCKIKEVLVHTSKLSGEAEQEHLITFQYPHRHYFEGSVEINYYPWFPKDGAKVASVNQKVKIRPRVEHEFTVLCPVPSPNIWSFDNPQLYKVEVILKDTSGNAIDDFVTTTGIRTVIQKKGDLYVNNKPEMLNGAQIMGHRTPVETMAKHNRCALNETVAEELLMIKKMDANLLRIHVHAEKDTADGINDPRYAEYADQMGLMLIWTTASFIREGEAWNIDFEGYPKFIKQVYNHPSIVMWEASNHPNRFKNHDISETHAFVKKIYNTIYDADQSRIISPTSFWTHTHYGNTEGTIDHEGNAIVAVPEYTAPRITRGAQDAYTGYGADWKKLRDAPHDWAASCLKDTNRAYFNFEHEESIGQPNWNLCKGKPWYLLQSYEWRYDDGSIGRKLSTDEWKESQAWQAFSAWESMKKQMLLGYDGFSWCCLHGGANMATYKKPLIDNLGHPKLAYYANKMVFQRTWAGSHNVDVVYGPNDNIKPVIHHLGDPAQVDLQIALKSLGNEEIKSKVFKNINLEAGRQILELDEFKFEDIPVGKYFIEYSLTHAK